MSDTPLEIVRHPLKVRRLRVVERVAVTPKMLRIVLGGESLQGFTSLAPEDHVKIFFPDPNTSELRLPTLGPAGIRMPSFGPKPIGRDYTPTRFNPDERTPAIDFYLHGNGVASTWAANARVGDEVGVVGPRGSRILREAFDWQLLVGDETAWPEIERRLSELSLDVSAIAVVLVDGASEEQPWCARPNVNVHWVHRNRALLKPALQLANYVWELQLPESKGFAWLAGEATEVRHVYRHLLEDRGWPKHLIHASGHWKRGTTNHDHHQPISAAETKRP